MGASTDTPVVDFGAHFHTKTAGNFGKVKDILGERSRDLDAYAEWFQASGIDHAVLSQPYFIGNDDREENEEINDELIELIQGRDTFFGLAALPIAAGGQAAAEELERCLDNGYNGGAIVREVGGIELTGEEIEPVFEVADRTGAPLFIHPTVKAELRTDVLENEYGANHVFGREGAYCASITKVIHSDVLDRYPNLNLVYHHLGGNIASMIGRLHLRFDVPWDDLGTELSWEDFKHRLESRIYVDTSGYYSYGSPLRAALEVFPSSQLLMGTDAPYEPRSNERLKKYVSSVEEATSDEDSRRILGGNALDLLVNV